MSFHGYLYTEQFEVTVYLRNRNNTTSIYEMAKSWTKAEVHLCSLISPCIKYRPLTLVSGRINFDLQQLSPDLCSYSWVGDEDPQYRTTATGVWRLHLWLPESCTCAPTPVRPWNLKLRICLASMS